MNFMYLDIGLLVLFALFITRFLHKKKKEIKKEGLLLLYHTSWGIKLIEKTGKKYKKTLKILSYFSVYIGYLLMIVMIYFFGKILFVYFLQPDLVRAIKIPPIMPLVPYLPQVFKLTFLPPFYFSYWIAVLAIIAITHEFFHGIFAKLAGVKTKTTGFGFFPFFFPVFLAAFVNLDEKAMDKKSNFEQRAVLSAGTFANVLTTILGVILMWGLFAVAFSPAGVVYDDYAYNFVNISAIQSVNDVQFTDKTFDSLTALTTENGINLIKTETGSYYGVKGIVNDEIIALYYDAPAIKSELSGPINSINGIRINNIDDLSNEISKYNVGDTLTLSIYEENELMDKEIVLEESPEGKPWIGITFVNNQGSGIIAQFSNWVTSYKQPNVYYEPNFAIAQFLYDFLWWLILISISVALVNMLPVGIFDGGRFFYLTVLQITGSKKVAENSFKAMTYIFLGLLLLLMVFWAKSFF